MTDHEILLDLVRGTQCACTSSKKPRMSFCRGCYGRLPVGVQQALYARDGSYPDAYRRALVILGFTEPGAKAPDRAPTPRPFPLNQATHK